MKPNRVGRHDQTLSHLNVLVAARYLDLHEEPKKDIHIPLEGIQPVAKNKHHSIRKTITPMPTQTLMDEVIGRRSFH